ncbi:Retrovirus-related Pol poly from transposon, partial [Paramuricea clavata]
FCVDFRRVNSLGAHDGEYIDGRVEDQNQIRPKLKPCENLRPRPLSPMFEHFSVPFTIYTDASDFGLGAVLSQRRGIPDQSVDEDLMKLSCSDDLPEEGNDNDNSKENDKDATSATTILLAGNGSRSATMDSRTVAKAFVNEVVTRHGVPSKLLTDQGRNFEADLMKQVFSLLGVRKLRTSPYHPQTDGQVERMNRTLKGILTAYVNKDHNDWDDHLPLALFAYRNSVHSSSGVSPFQAIYGREATTPLVLMNTETEVKEQFISNYCDELEKTLKDVHRSIKTNIDVAQSKQKKGYDEHNDVDRSTALKEGDRVWLNNKAVPKGLSRKFHSPWTGPYVVIKRLGKVNYHIKPGPGNGKTRVVHRNRLKLDIRQPRIEETLSNQGDI